jgi:hypothetical protein
MPWSIVDPRLLGGAGGPCDLACTTGKKAPMEHTKEIVNTATCTKTPSISLSPFLANQNENGKQPQREREMTPKP